ncbi:MAG: pyroglutamyl-peptidase I [Candidatus Bathyarchaeota archaeon]|nr:MAG: pyroglutamyl-peptidase I [Candidatus Bathyarchaeota archaeon]
MKCRQTIVLTGFEPFSNYHVNPSWEAAKHFDMKQIDSCKVKSFLIPLKYAEIRNSVEEILETESPKIVINLGQSTRASISLERVAINLADLTDLPAQYNCGSRPADDLLEPNGPPAYFSTLPTREILTRLREAEIPAEISYTAGTFGCNQIFYHTMHWISREGLSIPAGFIHVPTLPHQATRTGKKVPTMSLQTITRAVQVAVETTLWSLKLNQV